MTLSDIKKDMTARLQVNNIETPDLDVRILITHVTGYSAADMIMNAETILPTEQVEILHALIERRMTHEPIDHILEYREFYGRRFHVSRDVLSPRPETEGLVDLALKFLKDFEAPNILDLGTGSGAIIISVLAENPAVRGVATDISEAAINIARKNAMAHNTLERLTCIESDWFTGVTSGFDLILSNPPYITDAAMADLSEEVLQFDPDLALRGGVDGLVAYREIISVAQDYLNSNGALMLEIGYDQGQAVSGMMNQAGFSQIALHKDLSGLDRIVTGSSH